MPFHSASAGSLAAFVAIVVAVVVAFLWAVHRSYRTGKAVALAAAALAVWLGGLSAFIASGRMAALPFSGLPFFFAPILLIGLGAGLSPFGARVAAGVPLAALVGFQTFRLPLELVLHSWAAQGVVPETMTWTGQNWDIISGTLALAAAPFASRFPAIVRITNIVGFALLVNVMRVALLSSPVPFGWGAEPPLLLALHLPYAFIGPVCVGGALFGHVVLTRALWRR
ncbi:hypothetical protein [Opitutus sp. GAS368]|jgi:hypothetical protein|uniref:hypothetical protein n=1 Tax=Opitutus sp. GAS368 TaxID=1882749 RepID=UPI000879939B|nr:hypothetical protein [Opitutus sp. GAS368]SDR65808.1 hypothetical protein SAMN05444173_0119 [Opitutus sp. GAS368]